jgi:hypothetical protein
MNRGGCAGDIASVQMNQSGQSCPHHRYLYLILVSARVVAYTAPSRNAEVMPYRRPSAPGSDALALVPSAAMHWVKSFGNFPFK